MASQPKQPHEIRITHRQNRKRLAWVAREADCQTICAAWHNRFGGCLRLDDHRFREICHWIVEAGETVQSILDAIEAYYQHVVADPWYRQEGRANPRKPAGTDAHKDLASFLQDPKMEEWLSAGEQLAMKRVAQRAKPASHISDLKSARLWNAFLQLPGPEQRAIIDALPAGLTADKQKAAIVEVMQKRSAISGQLSVNGREKAQEAQEQRTNDQ